MCDPVSIGIAAVSAAAKAKFQADALGDQADARAAAQTQFFDDIEQRRDASNQEFQQSLQDVSREQFDQDLEVATQRRTEASQPSFNQRELLPGQGDASDAVQTAIVTSQDQTVARNDDLAGRQAYLDALGSVELGRNLDLLENQQQIGVQSNFAQGDLEILDARLNAAEEAGNDNFLTADIIGALGTGGGAFAGGPDFFSFGGSPSSISTSGIPIPGVKPNFVRNPFQAF